MCCCNPTGKGKSVEVKSNVTSTCMRKLASVKGKPSPETFSVTEKTQASSAFGATKKELKSQNEHKLWKHILLKVKHRKRLANGQMGNAVQAVNMLSGDKTAILADPKLIDDQDIPGLERLLREHVQLAPSDVSIYI